MTPSSEMNSVTMSCRMGRTYPPAAPPIPDQAIAHTASAGRPMLSARNETIVTAM